MRLMASHRLAVAASLTKPGMGLTADRSSRFLRPVDERLMLIRAILGLDHYHETSKRGRSGVFWPSTLGHDSGCASMERPPRRSEDFRSGRAGVQLPQVHSSSPSRAGRDRPRTAPRSVLHLNRGSQHLIAGADTCSSRPIREGLRCRECRLRQAPRQRTPDLRRLSGNNMFNTLGNFLIQPRAGLLFLDFVTVIRCSSPEQPGSTGIRSGCRPSVAHRTWW
jgi:hypothetical protein